MAVVPVSLLTRAITGSYGLGPDYSDIAKADKVTASALNNLSIITFDLIISETHKLENTVSNMHVEEGVDLSDMIRNKLRLGTLTGMVSDYSLYALNPFSGVPFLEARKDTAFSALKEIWQKEEPVDIVCVMEVYKDVGIKSIDLMRNGESGEAQEFKITFQELSIRKLQSVDSRGTLIKKTGPNPSAIEIQTAPPANLGQQLTGTGVA